MVRTWKVTQKPSNKTDQRVSAAEQKLPRERDPGCSGRLATCVGSGEGKAGCWGVTGWMIHFPGEWQCGDLVQPLPGNPCTFQPQLKYFQWCDGELGGVGVGWAGVSPFQFSSVQSLSRVWLFATPWTSACQTSLSNTNSRSPPKLMCIESVIPANHLILCRPILLLPSIFPSIRVFSNESALLIRWPKYWSFSFNMSPSNENPGLISFRMDWLDLLAVQGTLKSLQQTQNKKFLLLSFLVFSNQIKSASLKLLPITPVVLTLADI